MSRSVDTAVCVGVIQRQVSRLWRYEFWYLGRPGSIVVYRRAGDLYRRSQRVLVDRISRNKVRIHKLEG